MRLLTWTISETEQAATVHFAGELDMSEYSTAHAAILEAEESGKPCLVLDLSALGFMDASGIRLLVLARKRAEQASRRVAVVPGVSRRLLELAGLLPVFCLLDQPPRQPRD